MKEQLVAEIDLRMSVDLFKMSFSNCMNPDRSRKQISTDGASILTKNKALYWLEQNFNYMISDKEYLDEKD